MRVVAMDTATAATSVAVADGARVHCARHDPAPGERPGHATRLLGLLEEAMDAAGVGWAQVERLAVGVGPGSFTGLRIGIATARGLAQSRDLPLAGVSTLEALALGAQALPRRALADDATGALGADAATVLAVLDARRGEAFAAAYRDGVEIAAPAALSPAALSELAAALAPGSLAVGDGAIRFREHLEAVGIQVPADGDGRHRVNARWHCRLAEGRAAGPWVAVWPDYLRLPDAEIARRPA
jgi:tRNA threonylcarbamoyladenosine biosynthesis protein TsaB